MSSPVPSSSVKVASIMSELTVSPSKVIMKHIHCVQLEKTNYYYWEAQFSAMLRGFDLMHYAEGMVDLSSPLACQQDQLNLSWILTRILTSIFPQVASFRTSAGFWSCLQKLYAYVTQTRQLHLQLQLQTIRKGDQSMEEFIMRVSRLSRMHWQPLERLLKNKKLF